MTARGCLLVELYPLATLDGAFCLARRWGLHPPAVHVRTVAGVLMVARISGRALTRVSVGRLALCNSPRVNGFIAVTEVERCVLAGSVYDGQLFVGRIAVVGVRKHRLSRVEAEAQSEHARGDAAQD